MLWILTWIPLDHGAMYPVRGKAGYVAEVEGGAYETVRYGTKVVSFSQGKKRLSLRG